MSGMKKIYVKCTNFTGIDNPLRRLKPGTLTLKRILSTSFAEKWIKKFLNFG